MPKQLSSVTDGTAMSSLSIASSASLVTIEVVLWLGSGNPITRDVEALTGWF